MQPNSFKMYPDAAPSGNRNVEGLRSDSFQSKAIISQAHIHIFTQYPAAKWKAQIDGRSITFIMCRCRRRDTALQLARRVSGQDIMHRYRMPSDLLSRKGIFADHFAAG